MKNNSLQGQGRKKMLLVIALLMAFPLISAMCMFSAGEPPDDNYYSPTNEVTFTCSAISSYPNNITNISLWGDWTGTWEINETVGFPIPYVDSFDIPLSSLSGIASNGSVIAIVNGYDKVYIFDMNGNYIQNWTFPSPPQQKITWNGSNWFTMISVPSTTTIYKYDENGNYLSNCSFAGLYSDITSNNTNMWVTDFMNSEISELDMNCNILYIYSISETPQSITMNENNIFILDISKIITKYNFDGTTDGSHFHLRGNDYPMSLELYGDYFYVVNWGVPRIDRYNNNFGGNDYETTDFIKNISEGTWTWNCIAYNTAGESCENGNRTITIDTTIPSRFSVTGQTIYEIMNSAGAGLGSFMNYLSRSIFGFLVLIAVICVFSIIGYALAQTIIEAVKNARQ